MLLTATLGHRHDEFRCHPPSASRSVASPAFEQPAIVLGPSSGRLSFIERQARSAASTSKGRGCSISTRCTVPVPMPSVWPIFNMPVPPLCRRSMRFSNPALLMPQRLFVRAPLVRERRQPGRSRKGQTRLAALHSPLTYINQAYPLPYRFFDKGIVVPALG
jgi:hypothetical protein